MKIRVTCDWCGKEIERMPCQLKGKKHHFCSRACLAAFSNKSMNPDGYMKLKDFTNMGRHLSELNRELNPTRMTLETRKKLRDAHLGSGEGKTYTKLYGKAAHRVIAEKVIGRPLNTKEIVHHIDCNRRNNTPDNLMIMSQSEHARLHNRLRKLWSDKRFKVGDNA